MSRRAAAYGTALLSVLSGALALPAPGQASSGGAGLGSSSPNAQAPAVSSSGSGNAIVTASAPGITISSRASAMLRGSLQVSGQVSSSAAGATVELERLGRQTRERWARTAHARVASDGSFRIAWRVNHIGRFAMRVVILGRGSQAGDTGTTARAVASPSVTVILYRPSVATIYGPGFWGQRTACGETLAHRTLGVANRTLPCGTEVALIYHGRTLVVPVIDRGPYANGADWDLTYATAKRLGIDTTVRLGAVSLPSGG